MTAVPEILRLILREATAVPVAFDTSLDGTLDEDVERRTAAVRESMDCKCSLSLVSKSFHDIADEFLFEIICVRRFDDIRPLVQLLRRSNNGGPTHGWWCRRLELDMDYTGYGWDWGSLTLWGLLPSCPRVVDLRCSLFYNVPGLILCGLSGSRSKFCLPVEFAQTVASLYGQSLKRLELRGEVTIPWELASNLVAYTPALEICRMSGVLVPARRLPDRFSLSQRKAKERCPRPEEDEEYEAARRDARWPLDTAPRVSLPVLHTLDITQFMDGIQYWSLPSLRTVGAGIAYIHDPQPCLDRLKVGLNRIAGALTSFTHNEGTEVDIWDLIQFLPSLRRLGFHLSRRYLDTTLTAPHSHLELVTIYRSMYKPDVIVQPLRAMELFVQNGKLPALRTIRLWGDPVGAGHGLEMVGSLQKLGIELEIQEESRF